MPGLAASQRTRPVRSDVLRRQLSAEMFCDITVAKDTRACHTDATDMRPSDSSDDRNGHQGLSSQQHSARDAIIDGLTMDESAFYATHAF